MSFEDPLDYMFSPTLSRAVETNDGPDEFAPVIGRSARRLKLPPVMEPGISLCDYMARASLLTDLLEEAEEEDPDSSFIQGCRGYFERTGNLTHNQIVALKEVADPYFWIGHDKFANLEKALLQRAHFPKIPAPPRAVDPVIDSPRAVAEGLRNRRIAFYTEKRIGT